MGRLLTQLGGWPLPRERPRAWLWIALGVGTAIRLVLAFAIHRVNNDIASYRVVSAALHASPLHVYAIAGPVHWPYGPVFFSWILIASALHDHLGVAFSAAIKLPGIAADGILALLVTHEMLRTGFRATVACAAGILILLGPTFVINSAVHGQIDSVATLAAVGALVVWRRMPAPRRPLLAGLLAGLATATKTPLGLVLLPMLLTCRSRREAAVLLGSAGGLMAVLLAPFVAASPHAVWRALSFTDVAGVGGLPLVLKVDLHWTSAETLVLRHRAALTIAALLITAAVVWRRRVGSTAVAASLAWLAFYSVGTGFFFGYLVWGIPFFLLAGWVWPSAALMALVLIPTLLFETGHIAGHVTLYATLMTAVWVAFGVAFVWRCLRLFGHTGVLAQASSQG